MMNLEFLNSRPALCPPLSVVRTFSAEWGVDYRSVGLVWGSVLGGEFAVLQAPMFDGLSLDPFSSFDDG
jgi:hypothetical protein